MNDAHLYRHALDAVFKVNDNWSKVDHTNCPGCAHIIHKTGTDTLQQEVQYVVPPAVYMHNGSGYCWVNCICSVRLILL